MPFTIHRLPDALVILFIESDTRIMQVLEDVVTELVAVLDDQPEPVFLIMDVRCITMDLDDLAAVACAAVRGSEAMLHHSNIRESILVTADGQWAVVQQGMNDNTGMARRYHWLSEGLDSFVDAPHSAIDGENQGEIINLTDRRAEASRLKQLDLLQNLGPDRIVCEVSALEGRGVQTNQPFLPHLVMPSHHDVRPKDVILRRLHGALAAAANCGPADFADLLIVPGVGARTVQSLAMVAEVIHGAPCRFADPARFSFAHGGKDRHPYPVPTKVYDKTISVLKSAIASARLGNEERLGAIQRLDREARRLERFVSGPALHEIAAKERRLSHDYGGRSVFGWEPEPSSDAERPAAGNSAFAAAKKQAATRAG